MSREAVVTFDYEKKEPDELDLRRGDVIKNVVEVDEGWCEGMLNGVKGMFPNNFVEMREVPPEVIPPPTRESEAPILRAGTTAKKKVRRAKVTFSYAAENEDELTLAPGMVVESIIEEEEGWWRGRVNGREGVFPNNFVEEILEVEEVRPPSPEPLQPVHEPPPPATTTPAPVPTTAAPPKQPLGAKMFPGKVSFNPAAARANLKKSTSALPLAEAKKSPEMTKKAPPPVNSPTKPPELPDKRVPEKKGEMYRVTFAYETNMEDELNISMGDIVEIVNKDVGQEGWWEVRLGNKAGLIPNNFVELIPPQTRPPPPAQTQTRPPPPAQTQTKPPPPAVHQKEPPAIPGKPRKEVKKPPPSIPVKAEPPPPTHDSADNSDFGVPTTTPLDNTAVKNRPKKTGGSRPPSRSNLLLEDQNGVEPKPELPKASEKPPEKPEPAPGLSPWQQELKTRKTHKPPAPKPVKKPVAPKPAAPTPTSHKPELDKPKPPPSVSKPHIETKPPPHKETPSVMSTSTSANVPTPTPAIPRTQSQSQSRSITPTLPSSESTPPPDGGVWKAEFTKLREEFDAFKKLVLEQIEVLTDDLDKERKARAGLEVDIDRLKKAARPTAALR